MRGIYGQIQTVEDMSLLNGIAFEKFLAELFRDYGYEVDTTPKSGDYGADLIMVRDGKKIVVQAKQYADAAGFDAVKEVYFAKDFYKADEAWVVATHGFTPQALRAAESTNVRLMSGSEIVSMIGDAATRDLHQDNGSGNNLELASKAESDSSLFTLLESNEKLLQYHGRECDVVIPASLGIRFIGSKAFSDPGEYAKWPEGFVDPVCDWARIQSVVVPEGVTMIGHAAFKGCKSLRSISLPSTLKDIGPSAFEDCVSLRTINMPSSLEEIWSSAFKGCVSLQQIEIPQSIRRIQWGAFAGCESLSALSLPPSESIVEIQDGAFRESGIRSLTIRGNYRLDARCFERCFRLSSVKIESVQRDGGEDALEPVAPLEGVGRGAIGMENLPESTFELCRMLKDVCLPDTLVSIGDSAFANCRSLHSIDIPDSVTEMGAKAFFECSSLSSVRIPSGVETIRSETFVRCSMLADVTLSEGIKSIEKEAFFVCGRLRRVVLPASLEEIGTRAFASCDALADVVMSPSVHIIRSRTFAHCTVLAKVILPEGLESIENRAFWGCERLRRIQLPASIEMVAPGAFDGCKALEEVLSLPGCNGTIYRSAFSGCPLMKRDDPVRDLPDSATLVNDASFPSMFDGPSHELRALRFVTRNYGLYSEPESSHLCIVDRGVEGLNSFTGGTDGAGFWVVLNDDCDRGFYSVKGTRIDSKEDANYEREGYLEPKPKERWYSSSDPSQSGCGAFMSHFSVYLHNCHLAPSQTLDGALAANLVDAYHDKVGPLVGEYKRTEEDESGRGRKFEERKLAVLDGLHAKIKAVNAEFEVEAKKIELDYKYYVREYTASLGSGLAPSEKVARARASEKRQESMTKASTSSSLLSTASTGCGCLSMIAIGFVFWFAFMLLIFLL